MPAKAQVKLNTLSYVIIYVKDTTKSVPFYRDTLGIPLRFEDKGWVEFETGAVTVALHTSSEPSSAVQQNGSVPVFFVEDIHETYEALKASGVRFDKELQIVCEESNRVGKGADFRDPDGNRLSVFGYVNKP